MFAVAMNLVVRASRRRRRRLEEDFRRAQQPQEIAGRSPGQDPFQPTSFGDLLETLMSGMGTSSYRFDEATGQWVEMSDEIPDPADASDSPSRPPRPVNRGKARAARPRTASTLGPLGGLMGGLGGMG